MTFMLATTSIITNKQYEKDKQNRYWIINENVSNVVDIVRCQSRICVVANRQTVTRRGKRKKNLIEIVFIEWWMCSAKMLPSIAYFQLFAFSRQYCVIYRLILHLQVFYWFRTWASNTISNLLLTSSRRLPSNNGIVLGATINSWRYWVWIRAVILHWIHMLRM